MAKLYGFLLVAVFALSVVESNGDNRINLLSELNEELDPVLAERIAGEFAANPDAMNDREKRLVLLKKIGLKAGLLDFVFGKIDSFIDSKTRFIDQLDKQNHYKNEKYFNIRYTPPSKYDYNLRPARPKTTTLAPVQFEVNSPVSFQIPDRLYGSSFTLVTNASRIISDVIYNTANRAQEFADAFNNKIKEKFGFAKWIKIGDDIKH